MVLHYDKNNSENIRMAIDTDTEGLLNAIKILVEKAKPLENYPDGISIKVEGILKLNYVENVIELFF